MNALLTATRAAAAGIPYRARLVVVCSGLVAATVAVMLVPLFLLSRDRSVEAYRDRLTAAVVGGSAAVSPDSVRLLATNRSAAIP
jgi:hypothetical protein